MTPVLRLTGWSIALALAAAASSAALATWSLTIRTLTALGGL